MTNPAETEPVDWRKLPRNRGRVTGAPESLSRVMAAGEALEGALSAVLKARADRGEAVRQALAEGWSYGGLAEALGVSVSWVQRANATG